MLRRVWVLIFSLSLLLISACGLIQGTNAPANSPVAETPISSSDPTPIPQNTPESNQPTTITETTQILRVWVPPELAIPTESGTAVLQDQIRNYALTQTDLEIIFETKLVSGQGGILSYLRTGRNIAPEILPDLIAIPADQLDNVLSDELIIPLNDFIDPTIIDALYPAAQSLAMADDQILGYPFAITDLTHFAYNSTQITQTISTDWDNLISSGDIDISIPFGGTQGGMLVLQLYLAAGGTLVNEAGQRDIQTDTLSFVLNKLQDSVEQNALNLAESQNAHSEDIWEAFLDERTSLILTNSEQFLLQTELANTAVSPVSGFESELSPIVNGWAWAISTPNTNQQTLAIGLLNYLTSVDSIASWSESNQTLPANSNVLSQWSTESDYLQFIQAELFRAQPLPEEATTSLLNLLQNAALQVISGDASPQAAASDVANAFQE